MTLSLIVLLIIAIPIVSLIDYFAFRRSFERRYGTPVPITAFLMPCTLEIFCFIAGYILGGGLG